MHMEINFIYRISLLNTTTSHSVDELTLTAPFHCISLAPALLNPRLLLLPRKRKAAFEASVYLLTKKNK